MIEKLIIDKINKIENNINSINCDKNIDCVTIFPKSVEDYELLNDELLKLGSIIDKMKSGNLYYLNDYINTKYCELKFIKIRVYDEDYVKYGLSIDFVVDNYYNYKSTLINPTIKKYDTFELIQYKTDSNIINIVSLSASKEYDKGV